MLHILKALPSGVLAMQFLSLNDDVLIYITSFLNVSDLFSVARCSWRAYDVALPHLIATVTCRSPAHLHQLHDEIIAPETSGSTRKRHLKTLTLTVDALRDPVHTFHAAYHRYVPVGAVEANFVEQILLGAQNLRFLSLDLTSAYIKHHSTAAFSDTLSALRELQEVRFGMVDLPVLSAFRSVSRRLRRVTLHFDPLHFPGPWVIAPSPLPEPITLPTLLSILSAFPNLRDVTLADFPPPGDGPPYPPIDRPLFPTVLHLRIDKCSLEAVQIIDLCPNLQTLVFHDGFRAFHNLPTPRNPCPPLRHCVLDSSRAILEHITCRITSVDVLELHDRAKFAIPTTLQGSPEIVTHVSPGSLNSEGRATLAFIHKVRPIALRIPLVFMQRHVPGTTVLNNIALAVPQLRALDLELKFFARGFNEWLDTIAVRPACFIVQVSGEC